MYIGTNQRIGGLAMRYGRQSQRAPLDCTSSRRSTVMRALPRVTAVTTGYQRDSSSKRPMSSVTLVARALPVPVESAAAVDAEERAHRGLENAQNRFPHRPPPCSDSDKNVKNVRRLQAGEDSDDTHATYRVAAFQTFLSGRIRTFGDRLVRSPAVQCWSALSAFLTRYSLALPRKNSIRDHGLAAACSTWRFIDS